MGRKSKRDLWLAFFRGVVCSTYDELYGKHAEGMTQERIFGIFVNKNSEASSVRSIIEARLVVFSRGESDMSKTQFAV